MRLKTHLEDAVALIKETKAYSQRENLPIMWYTGPTTRPEETDDLLLRNGFSVEEIVPGMAIDMSDLPESRGGNFTIEHLTSDHSIADWKYIFQQGFDLPEAAGDGFIEFHRALGFKKDSPAQHFLARVDDEAAGIATVYLGAGAAGIYNISTLEKFRGRGIGREMTLAAMTLSQKKGFRVGVLQSSEQALPLYQKLGFREVCKINVYNYFQEKSE